MHGWNDRVPSASPDFATPFVLLRRGQVDTVQHAPTGSPNRSGTGHSHLSPIDPGVASAVPVFAMTPDELLVARLMFVNRLLRANGDVFQQLFWAVMRAKHGTDFVPVRPQGRLGDGGNDGYLPAEGHYYQVYGPLEPTLKIAEAEAKLQDDFQKVMTSWDASTPVRAYSFVFNDKYEGTFHSLATALSELERKNPGVRCRPLTTGNLEDTFLTLPAAGINNVLGALLPDPARIMAVDYRVLREAITHVMSSPSAQVPTRFGDLPTLGEKIALNGLCTAWGDLVRTGARQAGHVDAYFAKNSTFMKQALRDHMVERYRIASQAGRSYAALPPDLSRNDLVFECFRASLLPDQATVAVESAVTILIGYYFEACDVFDPLADQVVPSASA